MASPPLKVSERGASGVWFFVLLQKLTLGQQYATFRLENRWDTAKAFLTQAASTVLPLDLVYSSGDGNHDIGGPFRYFSNFLSFTALLI